MKNILIILCCLLASPIVSAATSIKAEVNGMVCAFCAKGIEKKLNAMPEGQGAFVDLKRRIVVLELKPQQNVSLDAFTQVIKEAGYAVDKVENVEQSIAEIKANIKASMKGQ
ncbi:MAG: heavy-metal-associated domain-containing protein [Betaproteobacteria bacterium]|jgi:cation transport ATPase|nr:heavy-metal-associated domain-containing protein [Betaproteobacteria bacterium]MCH9849571.1 heavy-metal-associated domain-containing protein [Betaproteobacteria bacterium]MDG1096851.1 heavy metal-associated domain-containing protein [Methylophilaceae bacterium]MDG1454546.1 heavy metal-associated domain-containing protein [Methylophilaceae bacterium]